MNRDDRIKWMAKNWEAEETGLTPTHGKTSRPELAGSDLSQSLADSSDPRHRLALGGLFYAANIL